MDQLIDAEVGAYMDFFREVDKLKRRLRKGEDMVIMDLIPAKRTLRYWIEAVAERQGGATVIDD